MFSQFATSRSNNFSPYILSVKTAGQTMWKSALVVKGKVDEYINFTIQKQWTVTQHICQNYLGSVPVDFLRPKFRVAHTKHDVISISSLVF